MTLYDFRLRFNFPETYRINSEADKLELLDLPSGEKITLVSGSSGVSISKQNKVAVIGKFFISKSRAKVAAEKCKRALLYWAIEQRLGLDFGDGKQRSWVTKAGLKYFEKQLGCPIRNDLHGIDVYEHVEKLKFVSFGVKPTVGKHVNRLINTFQREYLKSRHFTEKQLLASEIYASSFFDVSARSRFITLVTAVEALLEPVKRSKEVEKLVKDFEGKVKDLVVDKDTKNSMIGSLGNLKYQSISQAGRMLANRLLPNEIFDEQASDDFFSRSYDLRSRLLHDGVIKEEEGDVGKLANSMEVFVHKLLLAALSNESQLLAQP
jgi:hypothetical protein